MSVDYRSTAMIGCEVPHFDPDKNFDLLISKGIYWAQGGSCYSGDVTSYIVGLKKYLTSSEIGNQLLVLSREELANAYDETRQALGEECIWDENTFGLWAIGMLS